MRNFWFVQCKKVPPPKPAGTPPPSAKSCINYWCSFVNNLNSLWDLTLAPQPSIIIKTLSEIQKLTKFKSSHQLLSQKIIQNCGYVSLSIKHFILVIIFFTIPFSAHGIHSTWSTKYLIIVCKEFILFVHYRHQFLVLKIEIEFRKISQLVWKQFWYRFLILLFSTSLPSEMPSPPPRPTNVSSAPAEEVF